MGTQKPEEKKIYYTWKGNVALDEYHDYGEAKAAAKKMGQKEVDPPGFVYKEEAEAFSREKWDEYIEKHYKPFDAAKYDAVVYTDGSFTPKDKTTTSYGLIIFLKTKMSHTLKAALYKMWRVGKNTKLSDMIKMVTKENRRNILLTVGLEKVVWYPDLREQLVSFLGQCDRWRSAVKIKD